MATTTNFGWETPDDTDLVKDGALAMRTLGNAIDASLVDLKGGTTNQVLAKNSNTDMDFKWVTDATGIQATIFDAKGDLIAASAADTAARLAVGSNNFVLTADSGETTGLKWARPNYSLISRTSFTAQSSQAFDGVFSSDYKAYLIIIEELFNSTANQQVRFQFRYAGPTTQNASYYGGFTGGSTTGSNFSVGNANTAFLQISTDIGSSASNSLRGQIFVLGCDGSSRIPMINYQTTNSYAGTTANGGGWPNESRIYTGFILTSSSGNITGTVTIYGLAA